MTAVPLKRVAICVDDIGQHDGINEAVARLAERRRVNAVSCMVGGGAWPRSGPLLQTLRAGAVDVGLHLDFTHAPLRCKARSLRGLIASAFSRSLDPGVLRQEIDAQLDAFEALAGAGPDHVDGHQHVHQLPMVRQALLAALAQRYGPRLPWVRSTRWPGRRADESMRSVVKPWLIHALGGHALDQLACAQGIVQNRRLLGVYGFDADVTAYRRLLREWLHQAGHGDLLMCHAGLSGPLEGGLDPIAPARAIELQVLCEPEWDEMLASAGVRLGSISMSCAPVAGR